MFIYPALKVSQMQKGISMNIMLTPTAYAALVKAAKPSVHSKRKFAAQLLEQELEALDNKTAMSENQR